MKITFKEFLSEVIQTDIENKAWKGTFKNRSADDFASGVLGSGVYSTVRDDKTDSHMVKKYTSNYTSSEMDPYWEYLNFIVKNKLYENPYFPRVYKIKSLKDKTGVEIKKAIKEKLIPLSELNSKEITFLVEEVIGGDAETFFKVSNINDRDKRRTPLGFILLRIDGAISGWAKNIFKDKKLTEAVNHLKRFELGHPSAASDIHEDNIMARRTPYGAQLVFSDPFS